MKCRLRKRAKVEREYGLIASVEEEFLDCIGKECNSWQLGKCGCPNIPGGETKVIIIDNKERS